jgi:hypothetical protein
LGQVILFVANPAPVFSHTDKDSSGAAMTRSGNPSPLMSISMVLVLLWPSLTLNPPP